MIEVNCDGCSKPAEFLFHHDSLIMYGCFEHADVFMRDIAKENRKAGGTIEDTARGYRSWRASTGRPCTVREADNVARAE